MHVCRSSLKYPQALCHEIHYDVFGGHAYHYSILSGKRDEYAGYYAFKDH